MTNEELKRLVDTGREIEFIYKGKKYSITYYGYSRKKYISFCEFYKEPVDVDSVDNLLKIKLNNICLKEMIESLNDNEIWIY